MIIVRTLGLVALLAVAACQTAPPVQEMSDARQAIMVAREAGAQDLAVADLRAAEAYLESAEQSLSARDYARARRDAIYAKDKALEALKQIESSKDPGT